MDRRGVVVALGLGILYVGNSGTYYAGLETVSPSLAALIVYIYPAVVAVLTLRVGRRLEGRRAWGALGMALAGVVLAIGGIEADAMPPISGLLLVLVSPLIYSVWIVLAAKLSGERREMVGQANDAGAAAATATALMMTATAGVYWGWALVGGRPVTPAEIPPQAWGGLIGVGVIATFIAIQSFYAGTRRIGAAQAALISTVEPFYTITLAALLFGIALTPVQLLGGVLIIVGVVIAQTGPGAAARPMPEVRVADE
jgi:drug/metabolite transporter (DMT)-like permease